jgi:alanine racemase
MRATRVLIHLENLENNIRALRARIGMRPLICFPVKADAYGHGAVETARFALEAGVSHVAVATVDEGVELRLAGIEAPILLFSLPQDEELDKCAALNLSPLVPGRDFAGALERAAARAGRELPVHLKIDTGMGRIGCAPEEAAELARVISRSGHLRLAGTATHLAVSDSPLEEHRRYTGAQLAAFKEALASIRDAGVDPGLVHAANSGAVVFHEDAYFDMVRPGILLYGYTPPGSAPFEPPVKPVMELETRIAFIKKLKKGQSVSYGRIWTAGRDTVIATLPLGYADGLARSLSGNHEVYIRGRPYPLAGRICMDQCMADLGPEPDFGLWEPVTVFGGAAPDAAAVAAKLGTIPYEVTCLISKRVPRVYTGRGG